MKNLRTLIFILLMTFAVNAQSSSLICIEVPVMGRVTDQFGRGVRTTIHFQSSFGSPNITAQSGAFGFYYIDTAISCEIYTVRPLNRKFNFFPAVVEMNPTETPILNFAVLSE